MATKSGVSHPFFRASAASQIPDISELVKRPQNGFKEAFNFQVIEGDVKNSVGTIGFSFVAGGLTYDTRFMTHDGGRDVAEFTVKIPEESLFLRPQTPVSIAEKIYMLNVIHAKADTTWIRGHLSRLEKSCFDERSGKFETIPSLPISSNVIVPVKLFPHLGLNFPTNSDYKDEPQQALKGFEYWDAYVRHVMDLSNFPRVGFFIALPKKSMVPTIPMLRGQAENMVKEVYIAAQKDMDIGRYLAIHNFKETLKQSVQALPLMALKLG